MALGGNGEMSNGTLPAATAAANLRMGKAQRWNGKSLRPARCIRTIGADFAMVPSEQPRFSCGESQVRSLRPTAMMPCAGRNAADSQPKC